MSEPRCDDRGPEPERCLLEPRHKGWHKSNFMGWPNVSDSLEEWAAIGRHLRTIGPLPHLSLREIEYAMSALRLVDSGGSMATSRGDSDG